MSNFDLASDVDAVVEAVATIRRRIEAVRFIVPPTALHEVAINEHLRGIDFQSLTLLLQSFDVTAPVIATPREIVRKFCR
jgi:hypothetical protein